MLKTKYTILMAGIITFITSMQGIYGAAKAPEVRLTNDQRIAFTDDERSKFISEMVFEKDEPYTFRAPYRRAINVFLFQSTAKVYTINRLEELFKDLKARSTVFGKPLTIEEVKQEVGMHKVFLYARIIGSYEKSLQQTDLSTQMRDKYKDKLEKYYNAIKAELLHIREEDDTNEFKKLLAIAAILVKHIQSLEDPMKFTYAEWLELWKAEKSKVMDEATKLKDTEKKENKFYGIGDGEPLLSSSSAAKSSAKSVTCIVQ